MNTEEFSNRFDVLIHNYANAGTFGSVPYLTFDEYEKSLFLTQAQEELILELYTGKNQFGEGFEKTEEVRRYLSNIVKTEELSHKSLDYTGVSKNSVFFELPEDLWFITYESVILKDEKLGCLDGEEAIVVPVTQDEYYRISKNPFRGPTKGRVLRLDTSDGFIELVSNYNIDKYLIRYVSKPEPIILTDLDNDIYINGVNTKTQCKLNPAIHRAILERAVKLAIISRTQMSGSK